MIRISLNENSHTGWGAAGISSVFTETVDGVVGSERIVAIAMFPLDPDIPER